jgi:hypothetical protein
MPRESSVTKVSRAHNVARGLRKLLQPSDKVRINGVPYERDEIVDAFERHKAAIRRKSIRWAAYREAVAEERDLARTTNMMWVGLQRWANATRSHADIATLGMRPYRKTGPKTLQSKFAGAQKRASRRAAK